MAYNEPTPLTDEERAELEELRAAKERVEREELERLRRDQKHLKEDAEYYAERERRKEERRRERENPDYSLDDLPPMSVKQKIVLGVAAALAVALVFYLIWFNTTH